MERPRPKGPPGPLDVQLVGRDAEVEAILGVVSSVSVDLPRVVLLAGEPGVGKSRLAREVASLAPHRVVWSTCWEGDEAPSFWPWLQVLRALRSVRPGEHSDPRSTLDELLGTGREGDAHDNRFQLFDAFAQAIEESTSREQALVVVDDLQWADPGSIRLLRFLAADVRARRLTVIGTYRDDAEGPGGSLAGASAEICRNGLHLRLEGLSEAAGAQLCAQLGSESVDGSALHRRSGGNPFFIREFARLGDTGRDTVPASVEALVALRVAAVSSAARSTLAGAAVLGTTFEPASLGPLLETNVVDALDAVEELCRSGLVVRGSDGSFGFAHSVVQETVYATIGAGERVQLHARAATILDERSAGRAVLTIAHHRRLGTVSTDPVAAAWAEKAATWSFETLAYEQAASWYRHALALLDPGTDPVREASLLIRRAEASLAAGEVAVVRDTFRQAAAVARTCGSADLLASAALGWGSGQGGFEVPLHDATQIALLREALIAVGPDAGGLTARLQSRLSVALSNSDDEPHRAALSEQAIEVARRADDAAALGHTLAAHCDAIAGPDHCEQRLHEAGEIVSIAVLVGDLPLELLGRRHRALAALEMGDIADFDIEVGRFAELAEGLRQPTYSWFVPLWHGLRSLMRNEFEAAGAANEAARTGGQRAESVNAMALTFTQWWVSERMQGRSAPSALEMRTVLGLHPGGQPVVSGDAATRLRAVIDTQLGDRAAARAHLDVLVTAGLRRRPMDSEWLPEMAQLAEVAVFADHQVGISEIYELLAPFSHRFCVEGIGAAFTGSVHWYLAMLARAKGDFAAGSNHEQSAFDAHRRVGFIGTPPPLAALDGDSTDVPAIELSRSGAFIAEGATWAVTFEGVTRRLRDSKGLRDIAVLLGRPRHEVHCLELAGGIDLGGGTGPALDEARNLYKQRIRDLQEDVVEATAANDLMRAERAEAELDALVEQLSQAFGLSGRSRPQGSAAERARTTVTSRVRAAIRQIDATHPSLGHHLRHAVRTGTWCVYEPERPVDWHVSTDS